MKTTIAAVGLLILGATGSFAAEYSWTGFYIGLNAGYGWGDPDYSVAPDDQSAALFLRSHVVPVSSSTAVSGGAAGFQLGYNWQVSPKWLAGIEADFDWSNVRGTSSTTVEAAFTDTVNHSFENKLDWLGTLRARIGLLPSENLLVFATGGLAYGRTKASQSTTNIDDHGVYFQGVFPDGSTFFCVGGVCTNATDSQTSVGWTLGGGVEYAMSKSFTFKFEYLYVDLGDQTFHAQSQSFGGAPDPGSIAVTFNNSYNFVRGGINFKF
jgi:outer membrane immunogenic protein